MITIFANPIIIQVGFAFCRLINVGISTVEMSYTDLVLEGKALLDKHLLTTIAGGVLLIAAYAWLHKIIEGRHRLKRT